MWRILVSFLTVVGGAVVARVYSRPAPRAARPTEPSATAGKGRRALADGGAALRPGWTRPRPEVIPRPTYWPMVAALGVTLIFFGLVTSIFAGALGIVVLAIGAGGWIWELAHES